MAQFTCTITYPGGQSKLDWTPAEPTTRNHCQKDDKITFKSPEVKSILSFSVDSPFERRQGPKAYRVTKAGSLRLTIKRSFPDNSLHRFHFFCLPDGVMVPGNGGSVPVGGGN